MSFVTLIRPDTRAVGDADKLNVTINTAMDFALRDERDGATFTQKNIFAYKVGRMLVDVSRSSLGSWGQHLVCP